MKLMGNSNVIKKNTIAGSLSENRVGFDLLLVFFLSILKNGQVDYIYYLILYSWRTNPTIYFNQIN